MIYKMVSKLFHCEKWGGSKKTRTDCSQVGELHFPIAEVHFTVTSPRLGLYRL